MNSPIGQRDPVSIEAAERMLSFVRGVDDRAVWVKMAYVLRDEFGEAGFDMWDEWSQSGASYNAKDARAVWKSASGGTGKRATIGALIALAKEGGWKPSEQDRRTVSPEERAARAREREERLEAERKQAEQEAEDAAAKAADMWAKATPVSDHPYLARKKIEGLAARQIGDMLLIPMKQSAKELCGIQTIGANGTKLFMRGAPVKGAYCVIGKPRDVVVICEGYATGMSIHMATGHCVVVAFNCGNLLPVTEKIKAILKVTIIIAADDDSFLDLRVNEWLAESKWSNAEITRGRDADGIEWIDAHHGGQVKQFRNAGMISAYAAARKTGALLAVPRWYGDRPAEHTDFNDLHCDEGLDAVADCIQAADEPEPPRDHLGDQSEKKQLGESLPPSTKPVHSGGATPVADNTGSTAAGLTSLPVGSAVQENAPVPVILPEGGGDVLSRLTPEQKGHPYGYAGDENDLFIYTATPMKTAFLFHATLPEGGRILFWRGEFYSWDGARYVVRDRVWIEQRVYHFMAQCLSIRQTPKGDQEIVRYNPKANTVNDAIHALRAVCYSDAPDVGTWLDPMPGDYPGSEIIAFQNCFLHWPTRTILPSTDRLLVTSALEFDYTPDAGTPSEWMKFLNGIWGNDPESISTLAEMFGYLLTDDTSQHKIFMLVGPPRSGKGTILRVLEALVGRSNRCSPSLSSLGGPFGLQSLLGKRMAMISDARLSGKADQHAIIENMLRISGEDAVDVARKNLPSLDGVTLRARFVMATNELPAFSDASSALANRFVPFKFTTSFLGSEDHGLTNRLLGELSGVLLWALDGLASLRARGYFMTPKSANEITDELLEQTSPVRTFVAEKCILGDGNACDKDELFTAWKAWCHDQGRDHPGTKVSFGRQLSAAFSSVKRTQPRDAGTRLNLYSGIRLRHSYEIDDPAA